MVEIYIKDLKRITDAIIETTGIDFSNYAFSSFKRRISRFMEIRKVSDLDSFIERIIKDKEYTDTLVKEITVNVTEMFRDPTFWIVLRDLVMPKVCQNSVINIWHAACSTGEEVYSMAILLYELGLQDLSKIVATDLNSDVLKIAHEGVYTLKSQETNCKNYDLFGGKTKLPEYYMVHNNSVQFDRQLLKNVNFMVHNLAQDGPFATFDIILCRNVLIYFNVELQERVVETFNQSMAPGSFLGIGTKESLRWNKASRYLEDESYLEKIFRKTESKNNLAHFSIQQRH